MLIPFNCISRVCFLLKLFFFLYFFPLLFLFLFLFFRKLMLILWSYLFFLKCDEQIPLYCSLPPPQKKTFSWLLLDKLLVILSVLSKTREETPFHLRVKRTLMCWTLSTSVFRSQLNGNVSLLLYYQKICIRSFKLIQKLKGGSVKSEVAL